MLGKCASREELQIVHERWGEARGADEGVCGNPELVYTSTPGPWGLRGESEQSGISVMCSWNGIGK